MRNLLDCVRTSIDAGRGSCAPNSRQEPVTDQLEQNKSTTVSSVRRLTVNSLLTLRPAFVLITCLAWTIAVPGQADTASPSGDLSKEQIKTFLRTAKVVNFKESKKGVTHPWRLTLSNGTVTHDASFQAVDQHKAIMQLGSGRSEMNFSDSYKYNIAAYELAEMIGFDDMMPVYVERKWEEKTGSLSWWLPVKMDEADRVTKKIEVPPDAKDSWNKQMYKVRVFDNLVFDADPNLTNVLIGENWQIWRIDFTRAFKTSKELPDAKELERCDRQFLQNLKDLNGDEFAKRSKPYLTKDEQKAVIARRDKIVEHFQRLIAEKGENEVLY
jgi:hypothetical protein